MHLWHTDVTVSRKDGLTFIVMWIVYDTDISICVKGISVKPMNRLCSYVCREGPTVFKFDHVYPVGRGSDVTVVLYAQLGSAGFKEFHDKLTGLTSSGKISYVYRHYMQVGIDLFYNV